MGSNPGENVITLNKIGSQLNHDLRPLPHLPNILSYDSIVKSDKRGKREAGYFLNIKKPV
jgi:hypothetical protein